MSEALPAARQLADAISEWLVQGNDRLVVAIDGHGAAGKSLLAEAAGRLTAASLVHVDDFFRTSGPGPGKAGPQAGSGVAEAGLTARSPVHANPMAAYYDWARLRREALEPLCAGERASFRAFDWERDAYLPGVVEVHPARVILVEGVSSTSDALADLIDRTVLVVTPESERIARLHLRIQDSVWDEQWLAAERAYFSERPLGRFDLVVSGSAASEPAVPRPGAG